MINKEQSRMFADIVVKVIAVFPDAEVSVRRLSRSGEDWEDASPGDCDVIFAARIVREGITHTAKMIYSSFDSGYAGMCGPPFAESFIADIHKKLIEQAGVRRDATKEDIGGA